MARNFKLPAKHICLRVGILVFRQGIPGLLSIPGPIFRSSDFSRLDFFEMKNRHHGLPTKLQGALRTIMIGGHWRTTDTRHFPKRVSLTFQVLEHETCVLNTNIVRPKGAVRYTTRSYAIDPTTMPTVSDLDEWRRNLLVERSEISDFGPNVMDKFLLAYLNTRPFLPSVSLSYL
jgi:hypothetical protein